jgi:hypothetical protein
LEQMKLIFESYQVKINVSIDYKWLCLQKRRFLKRNIENQQYFS